MDYHEAESRIARLPITKDNYQYVAKLLDLKYEKFRPLMDELLMERMTVRDLQEAIRKKSRGDRPVSANIHEVVTSLLGGKTIKSITIRDFVAEDNDKFIAEREHAAATGSSIGSEYRKILVPQVMVSINREVQDKAVQLENSRILDAAKLTDKLGV